jgi:hypothetical protein
VVLTLIAVAMPAMARSKVALRTVEGRVIGLEAVPGEGDLELLAVELAIERGAEEPIRVLLAPQETCRDIGFEIEEGDQLRVRIFVEGSGGTAKAQKVQNITRGLMVRFRTMRTVPLWSATGAWHGGPSRVSPGGHHGRGGGGRSGSGSGPGAGPGPGGS